MMDKIIKDTEQTIADLTGKITRLDDERKTLVDQLALAKEVCNQHKKTLDITDFAGYLYELVNVQGRHIKYSGDAIKDTEAKLNKSEIDLDGQLAAYSNFGTTEYGIADAISVVQDAKKKVGEAINEDFRVTTSVTPTPEPTVNQEIKFDSAQPVLEPVMPKSMEPELKSVSFDETPTVEVKPSPEVAKDEDTATLQDLGSLFDPDSPYNNPFKDNNTISFTDALGDLQRMNDVPDDNVQMNAEAPKTDGRQKVISMTDADEVLQTKNQEDEQSHTLRKVA